MRPVATVGILGVLAGLLGVGCVATRFGYETAGYKRLEKRGGIEFREYRELVVALTPMNPNGTGADGSFRRLFQYISRGNAASQKVAMTTPVLFMEEPKGATMAFVMPAELAQATVPAPVDSAVRIERVQAGVFAALPVSGGRDQGARKKGVEDLKRELSGSGWKPVGEPIFASYDPPWIPRFLQRNEVLWRVDKVR